MRNSLLLFTCILSILLLSAFSSAYGVTFYNPEWNPQYGKLYDFVDADRPYHITVDEAALAITSIVFTINREARNAGITIYNLKTTPDFLPGVSEDDVYEYEELRYSGFVPHDTVMLEYRFKVEKPYFKNVSFSGNGVALHAYDRTTGNWITLNTTITHEDSDFIYYSAKYPGVHYLLIGKSQNGETANADVSEETEELAPPVQQPEKLDDLGSEVLEETSSVDPIEVVSSPELEVVPPVVDVSKEAAAVDVELAVAESGQEDKKDSSEVLVEEPPVQEDSVDSSEKKENVSSKYGFIFFLFIAMLIALVYYIFKKTPQKKSGVDKELHKYIKESLKRGKTHDDVKNRLLDVGWHPERVDKALSKHKK